MSSGQGVRLGRSFGCRISRRYMKSVVCCLFVDKDLSMTGAPRTVYDLLTGLGQRGFETTLITQRRSELTRAFRSESTNIRVVPLPDVLDAHDEKALGYSGVGMLRAGWETISYNRRVRAVLKDIAPDLVITRQVKGVLLAGLATRSLGLPLVWDIGMEKESKGIVYGLHWFGLIVATKVVTQAERQHVDIFGSVRARLWSRKLCAITPGVGRVRERRLVGAGERADRVDDGVLRVTTVATIHPRKDQETVIRAVARLKREGTPVLLRIVGGVRDEEYMERLRNVTTEEDVEDQVSFLGWRDDVAEILGDSDVFLLASKIEGVPQVIREAMLVGLPVVATRVGGVPEIVRDEETGFLVEPGDVGGMAAAISRLIESDRLRREMGAKARDFARKHFSVDGWLESYETMLSEICGAR